MNHSLTPGQTSVLRAFHEFGPMTDVSLAVYAHQMIDESQSSSGLRSRRAELVRAGLIKESGMKAMPSGRRARIHTLTPKGVRIAGKLFGKAVA